MFKGIYKYLSRLIVLVDVIVLSLNTRNCLATVVALKDNGEVTPKFSQKRSNVSCNSICRDFFTNLPSRCNKQPVFCSETKSYYSSICCKCKTFRALICKKNSANQDSRLKTNLIEFLSRYKTGDKGGKITAKSNDGSTMKKRAIFLPDLVGARGVRTRGRYRSMKLNRDSCSGFPKMEFACRNGGKCFMKRRRNLLKAKCKCDVGWTGKHCQRRRTVLKSRRKFGRKLEKYRTHVQSLMGTTIASTAASLQSQTNKRDFETVNGGYFTTTTVFVTDSTQFADHPTQPTTPEGNSERPDVCRGIDERSFNCMKHGVCRLSEVGGTAVPRCTCYRGWIGMFCQQRCGIVCKNRGVCQINGRRRAVCVCRKNFAGKFCERDLRTITASERGRDDRHKLLLIQSLYNNFWNWLFGSS